MMSSNRQWIVLMALCAFSVSGHLKAQVSKENDFEIYKLWTGGKMPIIKELPKLKHVKFQTIKHYEPNKDGYRFLHGVAIAYYRHHWVASFGHNKGPENTGTEEAQSLFSKTGRSWKHLKTIQNPPGNQAVSHGVLLTYQDTLWSFNGSFERVMKKMKTTAYFWDLNTKQWMQRGVVAESFWPLQEPRQMNNGQWVMAGAYFGSDGTIPAVAICEDQNFLSWQVHSVPTTVDVWGECGVIIDGSDLLLISRSSMSTPKFKGLSHPLAWVSFSKDYGQSWSTLQPTNLPMAGSKPYPGVLSNGQRYLIGTTTADSKNQRRPLTIAVSKPHEKTFSKIYCIRKAVLKGENVESGPNVSLAYPYSVERNGKLWVVYSNSGGRSGEKRSTWNNNSAELAIIPIKELRAD